MERYLGVHLLSKFTAFLNVYGAEESPEFSFEDSFEGNLTGCLKALQEFQRVIDGYNIDAYLSLEPWDGSRSFSGDFGHILADLLQEGYITQETFDYYMYSV